GGGGPPWVNPDGSYPPTAGNVMTPSLNKPVSTNFVGTSWSAATVAFTLPTNLIGNGPNQIPQGSAINQVKVVLNHREGVVTEAHAGDCGYRTIASATWTSGSGG